MTKAELRKARKMAHATGLPLVGELTLDRGDTQDANAFSETLRGQRARERWARRYDSLNGAPESDNDR
jgi:hypothetical protein